MKPEEPELPLQKSCGEHLGYFSTDVFAWLVFFFLHFFLIAIFTMYVSLKNVSGGLIDCGTAAPVLGVMQKKLSVLWKKDTACSVFQNSELALRVHVKEVSISV